MIGESGVGKTNILYRLTSDEFKEDTTATIAVEFAHKAITLKNGKKIGLQLWDTGLWSFTDKFSSIFLIIVQLDKKDLKL